jgi:hypothetical protein
MSNPKTLLEDLCEHALSCGAESIEVEYDEGREWVFARKGDITPLTQKVISNLSGW